jgi:glutathione S-transferase
MAVDYQITDVKFWLRTKEFLMLNPASEVPVLKNMQTREVICDSYLICEYIYSVEKDQDELNYFDFMGYNQKERYEIQRLHMWFDKKFYSEISKHIIEETFLNSFMGVKSTMNMDKLTIALKNLELHIKYIEYILARRKWLASESFSIADIAAATQLSLIDYLGYLEWNKHPKLREWYRIIKSKKGFKNILFDKIPGFRASKYYSELDF